ncbi:AAA family ATPase [Mycobacteroides abscessus]|uniref:AAA family ATPase n=1 Tax=Mycobacteroides abscessus TaxID=36809 RepID=UPI0009A67407|nr:AAA family ATPase [Mycobacteroides abscessus]RIR04089.1 hypothetical protein D2E35_07205 [Mycobacteroides abscessus]SKQ50307.1 Uncharacterised protein [Mycobacteroides abscessus subsp. massiliense]SLB51093.1 Uncharacterised protein [Mycobacteroides abscessus subsp. massiliense]
MTLYLVTGPPAAGKSTWVRQHAKHGDITIDYDAIASVLTPAGGDPHDPPQHIRSVTKAARLAAIDTALTFAVQCDVYLIHSMPGEGLLARYRSAGAQVITIDPGQSVVMARCKSERPWRMAQAAKRWYADQSHSKHPDPASKHDGGVMSW